VTCKVIDISIGGDYMATLRSVQSSCCCKGWEKGGGKAHSTKHRTKAKQARMIDFSSCVVGKSRRTAAQLRGKADSSENF